MTEPEPNTEDDKKFLIQPLQSKETGGILTNSYIRNPAEEWTKVHSSLLIRRNFTLSTREIYEANTEAFLQPIVDEYGVELVDVE